MPKALIAAVIVAFVLAIAYVFATAGRPAEGASDWLTDEPIAHRGRWTEGPEAPENSLAALDEAASRRLPVELDVRRCSRGSSRAVRRLQSTGCMSGSISPVGSSSNGTV